MNRVHNHIVASARLNASASQWKYRLSAELQCTFQRTHLQSGWWPIARDAIDLVTITFWKMGANSETIPIDLYPGHPDNQQRFFEFKILL